MNKKTLLTLLFIIAGIFMMSCEKYPLSDLKKLPGKVNAWPTVWYIYDDELNTKGSFEPYTWDEPWNDRHYDTWSLTTKCTENPKSGMWCIKVDWQGNIKKDCYVGFGFATTEEPNDPTSSIDMSTSHYKRLKFSIRGELFDNCIAKIEVPNAIAGQPNAGVSFQKTTLSKTWTEWSFPLDSIMGNWNVQKFYLAISLASATSGTKTNGGVIYIDDIRFE